MSMKRSSARSRRNVAVRLIMASSRKKPAQTSPDFAEIATPVNLQRREPAEPRLCTISFSPGSFVEPHVFEAPAIVLAVGHHCQPLDLGLPAGRGAQVIDDRARQTLLQFIIGVPHQLFALAWIGFHRLL